MKSIFVEIRCPYCGATSYHKSETLLLKGFETSFDLQLKDGSFFRKHCHICGKDNTVIHPLMYVDKQHHFVLLIKAKKEQKESDHELHKGDTHLIKRYISDVEHIGEKISILEDELDDRCIEILKVKLWLHYRKTDKQLNSIQYHDYDAKSKTLWFDIDIDGRKDIAGVEYTSYEVLKLKMLNMPSKFFEIDQSWALTWMKTQ